MERASAAFWISKSIMNWPYQNIQNLESGREWKAPNFPSNLIPQAFFFFSEWAVLENLLNTKFHLECFLDVQMLGEPLGKKLCEGLVIFENRFRIFIDQIFGGSKSDWIFWELFELAECRIRRPTLRKFGCGENWLGWWLFTNGGIGGKNCICFVYF